METDTIPRTAGRGYSPRDEIKVPGWHALVAWDVLCNNLATGLFLVAAVAELTDPGAFTRATRVAYPVALAFLAIDLVLLVADLGDPGRFHHMLRVVKLSSPMSLGVWSLSAFALVLTVVVVLGLLPGDGPALEWARRAAVVIGLVPAPASATYKGVLFSTSSQLGWKDARWLGGYLTSSALVLGGTELLVLCLLLGETTAAAMIRPALAALLAVHLVPAGLLLFELRGPVTAAGHTDWLTRAGVWDVGVGTLFPLVLLLVGASPFAVALAAGLVLAGSIAVRFDLVHLPHSLSTTGV